MNWLSFAQSSTVDEEEFFPIMRSYKLPSLGAWNFISVATTTKCLLL
jgi:hypothetical protein